MLRPATLALFAALACLCDPALSQAQSGSEGDPQLRCAEDGEDAPPADCAEDVEDTEDTEEGEFAQQGCDPVGPRDACRPGVCGRVSAGCPGAYIDCPCTRPWLVNAHLGVATPIGVTGLELERDLFDRFSVAAGGGLGLSGLQGSAWLRARLTGISRRKHRNPTRIGVGAGLSAGRFAQGGCFSFFCGGEKEVWDWIVWANLELFAEKRFDSGLTLRPYLGWSFPTAASDCHYGDDSDAGAPGTLCSSDDDTTHILIFAGTALGWRF